MGSSQLQIRDNRKQMSAFYDEDYILAQDLSYRYKSRVKFEIP